LEFRVQGLGFGVYGLRVEGVFIGRWSMVYRFRVSGVGLVEIVYGRAEP